MFSSPSSVTPKTYSVIISIVFTVCIWIRTKFSLSKNK